MRKTNHMALSLPDHPLSLTAHTGPPPSIPGSLCSPVTPSVMLVRKLVAVLESIERLPMFLYDTPGSSYGLQVSEAGETEGKERPVGRPPNLSEFGGKIPLL